MHPTLTAFCIPSIQTCHPILLCRQRDRSQVLRRRQSWVDHPAACWLFENGAVFLISLSRLWVTYGANEGGLARRLIKIWAGILVGERLQLMLHTTLVHRIYSHIPYFHPDDWPEQKQVSEEQNAVSPGLKVPGVPEAHGGWKRLLAEWFHRTAASQFILTLVYAWLLNNPKQKPSRLRPRPFSLRRLVNGVDPIAMCAKLAIVRTVVDIFFAGGHWLIHRPVVWNSFVSHKTHHEHKYVLHGAHMTYLPIYIVLRGYIFRKTGKQLS